MTDNSISSIMTITMEKLREMVDSNTVIGAPIRTDNDITLIPISKITFGFGSGGSDVTGKDDKGVKFGAGSGAGVNITPIAFMIISGENVKLLPMPSAPNTTVDRLVEIIPEIMDKISGYIKKGKAPEPEAPAPAPTSSYSSY